MLQRMRSALSGALLTGALLLEELATYVGRSDAAASPPRPAEGPPVAPGGGTRAPVVALAPEAEAMIARPESAPAPEAAAPLEGSLAARRQG